MKRFTLFFCALFAAFGIMSLQSVAQESDPQPVAFPGAEGFGRFTKGGRGGAVYHVTSLADDGSEGTLRWAVNQSGARTIVFDVSGTIFLKQELKINRDYLTIAGQTAPGDGICVADYPVVLSANNVIIRYLRFRLGNRQVANHEGDGLGGMDKKNIIIDHCSVSWSIDECLSVYGSYDLTVQWCLVSQSLRNSGHVKGAHGYGGNWGGAGASYHHNLMLHHDSRCPRLGPRPGTQTKEQMDLRNNVFYNWAGNGCYGGEAMNVNIVNNYYKPGPGTRTRSAGIQKRIAAPGVRTTSYCKINSFNADGTPADGNDWKATWHVWGAYYLDGNVNPDYEDVTKDNWTYGLYNQIDKTGNDQMLVVSNKNPQSVVDSIVDHMHASRPIDFEEVTTHSAAMAYERVLSYAGASLHRDGLDALMVQETRDGVANFKGGNGTTTPGIIDNPNVMLGAYATISDELPWPLLKSADVLLDTDQDGMPDEWETANGLDANNPDDRNVKDENGFTMLENYINSLVADITLAQNEGGVAMSQHTVAEPEPETPSHDVDAVTSSIYWPLVDKEHYDVTISEETQKHTVTSTLVYVATSDNVSLSASDVALGKNLSFAQSGIAKTSDNVNYEYIPMMGIATSVNNERTASDENAIVFAFKVADGYAFRPTNVSYVISKAGTDGVLYNSSFASNGATVDVETGASPARNNAGGGWVSNVSKDVVASPFSGDVKFIINIYSMGDTKKTLISDVRVLGELSKVASESTAVRNVSDKEVVADIYSVSGALLRRAVRASQISEQGLTPGLYIFGSQKVLVR